MNNVQTSTTEEDGILFTLITAETNESYDSSDLLKILQPGLCKVILQINKIITKTLYFKNRIETSKEKIIQDERMNLLRK